MCSPPSVVHCYSPSIWEVEAEGLVVQSQAPFYSKFKTSLGHMEGKMGWEGEEDVFAAFTLLPCRLLPSAGMRS